MRNKILAVGLVLSLAAVGMFATADICTNPKLGNCQAGGFGVDVTTASAGVNARWDNLTAGWKLDEESDGSAPVTRVDVLGVNDLTDNNTAPSTTDGTHGEVVDFSQASAESLSRVDDAAFGFTNKFTATIWVNLVSYAADQTFWGKWTYSTDGGWAIGMQAGTADLAIFIATSAGDVGTGCKMHFDDADLSLSTWYLITVVYDGTQSGDADRLKVWRDTTQLTLSVSAGAVPASLQDDGADLSISKFGGALTRYMDALAWNAYLFNVAKDSTWVAGMHNSGAGRSYPD